MARETERKFLVTGKGWRKRGSGGTEIRQAYLALTNTISLRVRIVGKSKAYITIKSAESGISRSEFEYPIPLEDAQALMKLRTGHLIKKRRHVVKAGKTEIEVDVFEGKHRGLIIAEVELSSKSAKFERPDWLGRDVTDQKKYYNASLARS
jgi:adenylate cyclase